MTPIAARCPTTARNTHKSLGAHTAALRTTWPSTAAARLRSTSVSTSRSAAAERATATMASLA